MEHGWMHIGNLTCDAVVKFGVTLNHELNVDKLAVNLTRRLRNAGTTYSHFEIEREHGLYVFTLPHSGFEERKRLLMEALEQLEAEVATAVKMKLMLELLDNDH